MKRAVVTLLLGLLLIGGVTAASGPTSVDVSFHNSSANIQGNVTFAFNNSGSGQLVLHGNGDRLGPEVTKSGTGDKPLSFQYLQREPEITFQGATQTLTASEDFDASIPNFTIQDTSTSDTIVENGVLRGYEINTSIQGNTGQISPRKSATVDLTVWGSGQKLGTPVTKGQFKSQGDGDTQSLTFDHAQNNESIVFTGNTTTRSVTNYTNLTKSQTFNNLNPTNSRNVEVNNGNLLLSSSVSNVNVDNFDDQDYSEYASSASFGFVEWGSGDYAAQAGGTSNKVISYSGLPNYPERGDTFEFYTYTRDARNQVVFAYQDSNNYYRIDFNAQGSVQDVRFHSNVNGGHTEHFRATNGLNGNTKYRVKVDFGDTNTNEIRIQIFEAATGNKVMDKTVTEGSLDTGGVGFWSKGTSEYNNWKILDDQVQKQFGWAEFKYTNSTTFKKAIMNWTVSEANGQVKQYVKFDGNSYTEWSSADEDGIKNIPDGQNIWVNVTLDLSSGSGPSMDEFEVKGIRDVSNQINVESEDPELDLDGDGTNEASYTGTLSDNETVSVNLTEDLTKGTKTWTVHTEGESVVDWTYQGNNDGRTYVSSVDVGGVTKASPSQFIGNGSNYSTSISLSQGNSSVSVDVTDDGEAQTVDNVTFIEQGADGSATWERTYSAPNTIHEYTVNEQKDSNVTKSVSTSGNTLTVNLSLPVGAQVNPLDLQTKSHVDSPSVDIDGDNSPNAQYTGTLPAGQTVTKSLPSLHGYHTFDISANSGLAVNWNYTGYNETRVYIKKTRVGNNTTSVGQYLGSGETYSTPVSVTDGKKTFGVITSGDTTPTTTVSELEVSGGYPAYTGYFLNPQNPITHEVGGPKDIVWEYSRSIQIAKDISQNITVWTNGQPANFTPMDVFREENQIVSRFRVEMDNGTFHYAQRNVEPSAEFIVYQDGIATGQVLSSERGVLYWNKSGRWSEHIIRLEKIETGDEISTAEPDESLVLPTRCDGQQLPVLGCVGDTTLFMGSIVGSGIGILLGAARLYSEYN